MRAHMDGLGAILWQEQQVRKLKPVVFASIFLNDVEQKYAMNELELFIGSLGTIKL